MIAAFKERITEMFKKQQISLGRNVIIFLFSVSSPQL